MFKFYAMVFIVSSGVAFLLTPLVRLLSLKMNWVDKPDARKINKVAMPLLGGLAIYAGFCLGLFPVVRMFNIPLGADKLTGLFWGSVIIILAGIHDDIAHLTPRRKLFYQINAAIVAYLCGFIILRISNPMGGAFNAPVVVDMLITVIWIVGFINAVNLLDGMDGLAAGVVGIISISLFFASLKVNNPLGAFMSIALAGSSIGFLRHNFHPARIFMGDTGSMFLGFILSLISIDSAYKGATLITFAIPVIAMGVPVIDTALSIFRRARAGEKIFKADKQHIHHKLLFREGSQREAVVILYFLTACFGLIAIGLSGMQGIWGLLAIIATAMLTLRWIVNSGFVDNEKRSAERGHK